MKTSKVHMSYYQKQLIQHDYCDNCFSQFICSNCSYYSFPCLNCELYGHICSLNCEHLPAYLGPRYPPGLPIPPIYVDVDHDADTVTDSDSECDTVLDTECDTESDTESDTEFNLLIKKVLPKGKTYKQVFNEEKNKNECFGCCEQNEIVDWIYNETDNTFELKNACENCLECGNLMNEDNVYD